MTKDKLAKAPTFDKDSWPGRRVTAESYRYFGQRPYWSDRGQEERGTQSGQRGTMQDPATKQNQREMQPQQGR